MRGRNYTRRPGNGLDGLTAPSILMDILSIMLERDSEATTSRGGVNARIAERVRALRAEASLTLAALASRSGVSRSMLSLIERGASSPTAVVLERVATGLGVPLATLFDDASAPPDPVARGERISWRDPESGYVRRNISPGGFPSPIQIVEVLLPAGARIAYETRAHEPRIHQQIWVRDGSIEVTFGNAVHKLAADDCLAMVLDEPIAYRNRTKKPARYVVVIATVRPLMPSRRLESV
jgi:transcriptional regulator with XRE-family HTH domain